MNAPLRVPTRTRTPLMTDSFHDLSAEMHLMLRPNERPHQPPVGRGAQDPTSRREERDGANLALAFPRRPVFVVEAHEGDHAWLTSPRPSGRRVESPRSPSHGAPR